jgi:hypothetical protein
MVEPKGKRMFTLRNKFSPVFQLELIRSFRARDIAQVGGPEFKPQYDQLKKSFIVLLTDGQFRIQTQ